MSAQIPETMLLSDLLKATGYDCPEELQGRTFAEATAGGDVQTNKAATIDVSAYTEPVVIKPDTDYESMQKNTVTLSNIPQTKTEVALEATENKTYTPEEGQVYNSVVVNVPPTNVSKLYCWKDSHGRYVFSTATQPAVDTKVQRLVVANSNVSVSLSPVIAVGEDFSSITVVDSVYSRYSEGDLDFSA